MCKQSVDGYIVADALLGGLFAAGRTCGPPNALVVSTRQDVIDNYVESTCFYTQPILGNVQSEVFNVTFEYDIGLAMQTDPYVTGPLLAAYRECVEGPQSLAAVPAFIYETLGRVQVVSIDSVSVTAAEMASATLVTEGAALSSAAGLTG